MKTYNKLYEEVCSMNNLANAWRKARKGKTKKIDVMEFEQNIRKNLLKLKEELLNQTYKPEPMKTFILRDPKTRKISKSTFRDRIIHHSLIRIIEPIFDKTFIYDNCANRKGKGNLFALKRFDKFKRKVSKNGTYLKNKFNDKNFVFGYCFKADIKHYFQEINHEILLKIIKRKISDINTLELIKKILKNGEEKEGVGMPLGNLTSQFFANLYLNKLDYFVKNRLRAKFYIRYVDDFVLLHNSKKQLELWKFEIDRFLRDELKIELHAQKSKIIPLGKGIDFVGFRNFYYFRLLRKRNIKKARQKIEQFNEEILNEEKLKEIFQGWLAYAKWANSYNLRKRLENFISSVK